MMAFFPPDNLGRKNRGNKVENQLKICWLDEQEERPKMIQAELSSVRAWQKQKDCSVAEMLPSERPRRLLLEVYFSMKERMLMACADAESRSSQCALLMADAAAKSEVVQARLSWLENVRDMTSSLARSNLLKAQGLPKWIILEGRALA